MQHRKSLVALLAAAALTWASAAQAHCDTLDGPVVAASQAALDSGNVNLALPWVRKADEAQVRTAFARAQEVRRAGGQARALADLYFHETLVRVHRAGEDAPYTGLKPAGSVEAPVAAADEALASGTSAHLRHVVADRAEQGLRRHYEEVMARRKYDPEDVEAGRAFTAAYVAYVHYAERVYEAAGDGAHGH